ncbi:MAG: hypothetical protein IJS52_01005 [Bacilli bacterium]|nr:hypothetical protein [Bacilli bacterium]
MDGKELSPELLEESAQENLSILEDSLSAYEWLRKRKYRITLAHKQKETVIDLVFLTKNYSHASGVDKLSDVSAISGSSPAAFYRSVIASDNLKRQLAASTHFNGIIHRLYSIIELKDNFEDAKNNRHVKFAMKRGDNYTMIDYDYFIESQYEGDHYYYFLRYSGNSSNPNECVLISTFIENNKDYSLGQARMTLLRKTLIEIDTNNETVIYDCHGSNN